MQALTDLEGTVLAYSVTTRDKNFNPAITIWTDKEIKIELGKTKFIELKEPNQITSYMGVHNFYYSEHYYFGNPGLYQSYYFTLSETGYMGDVSFDSPEYYDKIDFDLEFDDSNARKDIIRPTDRDVIKFRENSIINTFTVTAPLGDFDGEVFKDVRFGPDLNQVRVMYEQW